MPTEVPSLTCQSLRDDETPCGAPATKVVRGRPDFPWRGIHCDACAERVSKMFDHQEGCVVEAISEPATHPWSSMTVWCYDGCHLICAFAASKNDGHTCCKCRCHDV